MKNNDIPESNKRVNDRAILSFLLLHLHLTANLGRLPTEWNKTTGII